MLNTLARGAMGHKVPPGSISLIHLLDEKSLDHIADNAAKRIWRGFMNFGSASAGILGIILIFRLAKLIIDTVIHEYALHSVYGWSLHLLGAIWTSITNLLLHLGRPPNTHQNRAECDEEAAQGTKPAAQPPRNKDPESESESEPVNGSKFVKTSDVKNLKGQIYTYTDLRERLDNN